MAPDTLSSMAVCPCGQTRIALTGAPIVNATCYCTSCRTAAEQFEREPGAPRTVNDSGGVDYCSYRKDRVRIVEGQYLQEYRLKADSPTRRVVARCCNAPMFVDFTPGHWLSIFRDRLPQPAPASQMLLMTGDKSAGAALPAGVPAFKTMPPRLLVRLIASWAAMGFRRPKIRW